MSISPLPSRAGEPFTLSVAPGDPATWKIQGLYNTLQIPDPLFRKNADRFYWYEYLAAAKALYVQYASCQDDSKQLFADFTRDMFAFADCHPVERVIVDLRFNGGRRRCMPGSSASRPARSSIPMAK